MIPGLAQWVRDLALLRLWCRLAATAPIGPLASKPPYATHAALKRQNNNNNNKKKTPKNKKRFKVIKKENVKKRCERMKSGLFSGHQTVGPDLRLLPKPPLLPPSIQGKAEPLKPHVLRVASEGEALSKRSKANCDPSTSRVCSSKLQVHPHIAWPS